MLSSFLQVNIVNLVNLLPRRLITIRVYIGTLPVTVFVTVFIIPLDITRPIEYIYWLVIGLLSHLAMLPFLVYGLNVRGLREQALLVLAMGLVQGLTVSILEPLFGFEDQFAPALRALNSMLFTFYIFQIFAIVHDFRYGFRSKVSNLLKQSMLSGVLVDSNKPHTANNELVEVVANLQEKIRHSISSLPKSQGIKESTKEIDNLVRDYVRPLSKSKWSDGEQRWMKLGFFRVLKRTLSIAPIPVFEVFLLTLPIAIIIQISSLGYATTFITQCAWLLAVFILVKGSKLILPAKRQNYFPQNVTIVLSLSLIIYPLFSVIVGVSPGTLINAQATFLKHLYPSFFIAALLITGSLLSVLNSDQKQVIEYMENHLDKNKAQKFFGSGKQAIRDTYYAQYLHAEVQSKLLACKLLLLRAAESDFQVFSPELTNQILSRLDGLGNQPINDIARTPSERIKVLVQSWKGLADISFELPPDFDRIKAERDVVSQLIEEGVINAIRHGNAKKVEIKAFFTAELLNVVIHDDGVYVKSKKSDGLGSILLDTFAKQWDIASNEDGTTLRFSVEIASGNTIGG